MRKLMETMLGDKVRAENQRTVLKEGIEFVGSDTFQDSVNKYLNSMSAMIDKANAFFSKPNPNTGEMLSAFQKQKVIDQVIDLAGKQISMIDKKE